MPADIRLYDEADAPWIARLLDVVETTLGQPWRVLVERLEHAAIARQGELRAMLAVLRRLGGSRRVHGAVARRVRALVLGVPALDAAARAARLERASLVLGLPAEELEHLLWADLALERPVALPEGRPREATMAAYANLDRIQAAVRRARSVRLRVDDHAEALVRAVARYGLIATATRETSHARPVIRLEITGPLALFHETTVYGRALAALMPLLADHAWFELAIACETEGYGQTLHVEPPVLLPRPRRRPAKPTVAELLARDLVAEGWTVRPAPPIAHGAHLVFPGLVVAPPGPGARETWIDVLGFSTDAFVEHRLATYRAAGIERVVLCVDHARHAGGATVRRPELVPYSRRIEVARLVTRLEAPRGADERGAG